MSRLGSKDSHTRTLTANIGTGAAVDHFFHIKQPHDLSTSDWERPTHEISHQFSHVDASLTATYERSRNILLIININTLKMWQITRVSSLILITSHCTSLCTFIKEY